MTREKYCETVARFMSDNDVDIITTDSTEPYFSRYSCELCEDTDGGDRYDAIAAKVGEGPKFELSICANCVHYCAYGQLDDLTMMELS